jgi:DNA modification methylase
MITLLQGNCLDKIQELDDNSIDCVVSSPPYFGLRDYGVEGQFGLEETLEEYIEKTVLLFEELRRVLKPQGTVWWNVGDSYNNKPAGNKDLKKSSGLPNTKENLHKRKDNISKILVKNLKEKDLMMIPNRVAIALQDDGWWIRSEIIWHKPNPMPESVKDRPTSCHEKIWLITKNKKYYYDADAIREPVKEISKKRIEYGLKHKHPDNIGVAIPPVNTKRMGERFLNPLGKNKRNVWTITTKPCKEAHFATFPKDLIEPCIKAGCPEKVCVECGKPYMKKYERKDNNKNYIQVKGNNTPNISKGGVRLTEKGTTPHFNPPHIKFLEFNKDCKCETEKYKSGIVLDPFGGSGTTGIVSKHLNRKAILIELNEEYIAIAKKRIDEEFGFL